MTERAPVPRANVLGIGVGAIHLSQAVELILSGVANGDHGYITVTGVHGVMEAQADAELHRVFDRAWLVTPDGMPMTWVGRWQGHREMNRVYGPDLMRDIFHATRNGEVRHFLYGGEEGVAERLKALLTQRFPGTTVCGIYTPPFRPLTEDEESELEDIIRHAAPHIIWIGLSTPKQERFMAAHFGRLSCNFLIGVGAAFDMHSGRKRQAPLWMQRSGFEWLFRLCQEPRRLWYRYTVYNSLFVVKILMQLLGLRRYSIEP
ncbi:MAG: WecB/TagA/CpsF family glycosyltransferase [Terrimicrobiaceae bacterium]|nr:WecB/TagA/CpsF family glycosyltransferase [Terrimicrobiaceae bacterium]